MDIEKKNQLKRNFKLRNIEVEFFETLEDVKEYILNLVPNDCTIGIGHSKTLQNINITNLLMERGNTVYDKELVKIKKRARY